MLSLYSDRLTGKELQGDGVIYVLNSPEAPYTYQKEIVEAVSKHITNIAKNSPAPAESWRVASMKQLQYNYLLLSGYIYDHPVEGETHTPLPDVSKWCKPLFAVDKEYHHLLDEALLEEDLQRFLNGEWIDGEIDLLKNSGDTQGAYSMRYLNGGSLKYLSEDSGMEQICQFASLQAMQHSPNS